MDGLKKNVASRKDMKDMRNVKYSKDAECSKNARVARGSNSCGWSPMTQEQGVKHKTEKRTKKIQEKMTRKIMRN